ncbi:PREDICTED: SET domain-containing protein 4 isoform X2 [Myotis davidii]|uniref:SET domain-containing protein 4 isoform X2 n=1 Tax=Myotis davidii TaxID=225400 RepID=UPI0007675067|nr:PREDICTED: SET domain-containing protein 4 isoform X2 [Myotis davidii]
MPTRTSGCTRFFPSVPPPSALVIPVKPGGCQQTLKAGQPSWKQRGRLQKGILQTKLGLGLVVCGVTCSEHLCWVLSGEKALRKEDLPGAHEISWASADRPGPLGAELTTRVSVSSDKSNFFLCFNLKRWQPPPSPLLALCTFLVAEKHAGDRSPWKPYLEVLPKAYTCPVCLEPEVVALLPRPLEAKAREQRTRVRELFTSSRGRFSSLQPLLSEAAASVFSYRAFRWAWCTVNTRAVYMERGRRQGLSAEPDTCALAPYLDLLNNSPAVQVKAAFNEETRCYEIRTGSGCRRHEEVFICYGPHDSRRLLLEYGNLTFGWDGPSWRLLTALKLLCLEAGEFPRWKKVLLGERISDTNEKTSLDVAQKICRYFTEEASAMLQKVSHMKDKEMALIHQLTLVETLWTEELKILRASAETLSGLQAAVRDSPTCLRSPPPLGVTPSAGCDAGNTVH